MPLPANVTTVTVRGTFLTPEGDPSTGTVSFTPSSWLLNSGANIAIPNSSVVKTLGTAGDFSAVLPITDDPDLSPGGWVYSVSEVVDGVSQSYNIAIPGTVAAGGTVFLADLAPVAPAGPEYYSLASSLAIGTVTTVATGGSATASITGLAPSQVLNLGIPVGATGAVASAGSGSVGTAAVAPTGDPNTGIYFPASDTLGIVTGGSERVRVDSSGNVGIGTSSPTFLVDMSAGQPILGATSGSNTAAQSGRLLYRRSRGTNASPSATQANDSIAIIGARGYGATAYAAADRARIEMFAAENHTDSANGTYINFQTTAAGGTTTSERMRIAADGLITGTGTSLGAWVTTWTPTLTATTTNPTLGTGSFVAGSYCQIGKIVHVRVRVSFGTSGVAAGSGTYQLDLPVASVGANRVVGYGFIFDSSAGARQNVVAWAQSATSVELFYSAASGSPVVGATAPWTWQAEDSIYLTLTYQAT